jgi:hypothetical protein
MKLSLRTRPDHGNTETHAFVARAISMRPCITSLLLLGLLVPAAGCSREPAPEEVAVRGVAQVAQVTAFEDAELVGDQPQRYTGLVAHASLPKAGFAPGDWVDVHFYARNTASSMGTLQWVYDGAWIYPSARVPAPGAPPRRQGLLAVPVHATTDAVSVDFYGQPADIVDVYYSQGIEMRQCIEATLRARRCRETGGASCDQQLAQEMLGHPDVCSHIDGLVSAPPSPP